ncbi:MAG: sugar transferase [Alphaproteobacteria bacterium]|nr:sugar transferase [Alphaproteobacteria bacterium]
MAYAAKRGFDVLISAVLLVILLPLMLLLALLIRMESPGPALFVQARGGRGGRPFRLVKFRTMCREAAHDASAPQALPGDPRITRLGRMMRRTSLDELPQLLNVLRGDMSLIGPRPHALAHDAFYRDKVRGYTHRLRMKPGITGWAQVHSLRGPTETPDVMQARADHDNHYIDHWSPVLDAKILMRTVGVVIAAVNAH